MEFPRSPRSAAVAVAVVFAVAALAPAVAPNGAVGATTEPVMGVVAGQLDENDLLTSTIPNDFYPENRDITDCISALRPPDCGSAARTGWPQFVILALLILGVGTIAARVMISSRRARRTAKVHAAASRSEQNATEPETS